jgi:hypothetical protein
MGFFEKTMSDYTPQYNHCMSVSRVMISDGCGSINIRRWFVKKGFGNS